MIVVPPMQSISGDKNSTYTSYMSPVRSRYLVLRLGVDAHHARVAVDNQLEIRVFRKRFPYFKEKSRQKRSPTTFDCSNAATPKLIVIVL
jgi:hypothetical protein